ncbi:hypothetical protein EDB83DRAFT_554306 [Lactarius deliciosus]|nr:hypothetical protein EDB83DRAFT_554306 [Lactarius deliciosus]
MNPLRRFPSGILFSHSTSCQCSLGPLRTDASICFRPSLFVDPFNSTPAYLGIVIRVVFRMANIRQVLEIAGPCLFRTIFPVFPRLLFTRYRLLTLQLRCIAFDPSLTSYSTSLSPPVESFMVISYHLRLLAVIVPSIYLHHCFGRDNALRRDASQIARETQLVMMLTTRSVAFFIAAQ